jgi:hypothetical protein
LAGVAIRPCDVKWPPESGLTNRQKPSVTSVRDFPIAALGLGGNRDLSLSVENGWPLFHKRVNAFLSVVGRVEREQRLLFVRESCF